MSTVHPTLEAIARAICNFSGPDGGDWREYLPEARAALRALADDGTLPDRIIRAKWLREIAAEPTRKVRVTIEGESRTDEHGFLMVNVGPEPITVDPKARNVTVEQVTEP